jgi:hypothetical protein
MVRILATLVLVRLLSQTAGVDLSLPSCGEPCCPGASSAAVQPAEGSSQPGGGCAESCAACLCCPHHTSLTLPSAVVTPAPRTLPIAFAAIALPVPHPPPGEILHIPKRRLSA